MTSEVHPTFTLPEELWKISIGKSYYRARTLRELQIKIGDAYTIKDYYPCGYLNQTIWSKARFGNHKIEIIDKKPKLVVDLDTLERLADQGLSRSEIAKRTGLSKSGVHGRLFRAGWKAKTDIQGAFAECNVAGGGDGIDRAGNP